MYSPIDPFDFSSSPAIATVEWVEPHLRVTYSASTWPAKLVMPNPEPLARGQMVKIIGRRGLTLIVTL
jgi:membrane protein implicated in regulation of membrane protease activity